MNLPPDIMVYGNTDYRGVCASETVEQVTFFGRLREKFPDTWGLLATHIRNEGKRHWEEIQKHKAEGLITGAADIIIPGSPTFVCELKRRDHTKSTLGDKQLTYLRTAKAAGAFTCIALGVDAATEAFNFWRSCHEISFGSLERGTGFDNMPV